MMEFFRKYQKIVFIGISFVLVFSLVFFGAFEVLLSSKTEKKDEMIGRSVTSGPIYQSNLDAMTYFLSVDCDTLFTQGQLNTLNDGVVAKDFLETKIAKILFEKYANKLQENFSHRLDKMKKPSFYQHPLQKEISALNIWKYFSPDLYQNLQNLKEKQSEVSFDTVSDLYLGQKKFSPQMLKQVLVFQQKQAKVPFDSSISERDLSLFGFKDITDWFGKPFLQLISQYILNAADIAKEKGYRVSYEEALSDLVQNAKQGMQKVQSQYGMNQVSQEDAFSNQLQMLGLSQEKAVEIWQKVLLFRKMFNDVGNSVFIDDLPFKELSDEKAEFVKYQLPHELRLKSFQDLMQLQVYLQAISKDSNAIDLPENYYSLHEIEKNYPELIVESYQINAAKANLDEICLTIGEKELWSWQLQDQNWMRLQAEFPKLLDSLKMSRFTTLESLSPQDRKKIDTFSRHKILEEDKSRIFQYMQAAPKSSFAIKMNAFGGKNPLKVKESQKFLQLLETFEKTNVEKNLYSEDGKEFIYIENLQKNEKEFFSYKEAKSYQILEKILDKYLEKNFASMQKKYPNTFKEKNFQKQKELLGAYLFDEMLTNLEKNDPFLKGERLSSLELYPSRRLYHFMKNRQKAFQEKQDLSKSQWQLLQTDETYNRLQKQDDWIFSAIFFDKQDKWSSIHIKEDENIEFFFVKQIIQDDQKKKEKMQQAHKILVDEAKRDFAKSILQRIDEKKALQIFAEQKKSS